MLKLNEILAARFRRASFTTIKEFWVSTGCKSQLSEETVSRVIGRGHEPGIPTFVIIAYYLGIPAKDIALACRRAGDTAFANLLDPPAAAKRAEEEQELIDIFNRVPEHKRQFTLDLLKTIGD